MPLIQGQVSNISSTLADGNSPNLLMGKSGELIASDQHGAHFIQTYRGNTFIGSTAIGGVVVPSFSVTGQVYGIWNPAGSGKLIVPIKVQIGCVAASVQALGFVWGYVANAGSQLSSGSTISAGTVGTPVNAYLGSTNTSKAIFFPATVTTTAPSYLRSIGTYAIGNASPVAQNNYFQITEYYNGDLYVGQGSAIFLAANAAGAVGAIDISCTWCEIAI